MSDNDAPLSNDTLASPTPPPKTSSPSDVAESADEKSLDERLEQLRCDTTTTAILLDKKILFLEVLVRSLCFIVALLCVALVATAISSRSHAFDERVRPLLARLNVSNYRPCRRVDELVLKYAHTCLGAELMTDVRSLHHHIDSLNLAGASSHHIGATSCVLAFRAAADSSLYTMVNARILYRGDEHVNVRQRDRLCATSRIVDRSNSVDVEWFTFARVDADGTLKLPVASPPHASLVTAPLERHQQTFHAHDAYIIQQLVERLDGGDPC